MSYKIHFFGHIQFSNNYKKLPEPYNSMEDKTLFYKLTEIKISDDTKEFQSHHLTQNTTIEWNLGDFNDYIADIEFDGEKFNPSLLEKFNICIEFLEDFQEKNEDNRYVELILM